MKNTTLFLLTTFIISLSITGCSVLPAGKKQIIEQINYQATPHKQTTVSFEAMIDDLQKQNIILIGEQHTRMDHHLTQLSILQALHKRNPDIALGVEWFQQDFQQVLDDYVAGRINENDMLRQSQYYDRWKYDYRLYKPILDYVREHQMPLLALNAPVDITKKVGQKGLQGLNAKERKQLPATINPPSPIYQKQLTAIFKEHYLPEDRIKHFITVQRIWDETMAANSLKFLQANPNTQLIIMAGSGHIAHDDGIGSDIKRQAPDLNVARVASLVEEEGAIPLKAEYLVRSREVKLPPTGKMGVMLNTDNNQLMISNVKEDGAADKATLQKDDVILQVNGVATPTLTDLRLLIGMAQIGEKIDVLIQRKAQTLLIPLVLK
jgi:uncharacterized iron-regulated protein